MYFAGGTIVKSRLPNSSSVFYNNIPNREFWFDLPSLCKDGFVFALSGGKKKGGDEHDDFNKDPDVLDRAPVNVLPLSTPLLAPLVCVMRTTHGGDGCRSSFLLLSASPAQLRSHSELTHCVVCAGGGYRCVSPGPSVRRPRSNSSFKTNLGPKVAAAPPASGLRSPSRSRNPRREQPPPRMKRSESEDTL